MKIKAFFALFAGLFLIAFGQNANAQTKVFAYADADSIIESLPEYDTRVKELESYQKQLVASMESQQKELEAKFMDFQKNQANWLPEIVNQKGQELQMLERNLQQFQQTSQMNLQKKQQEALVPLQEKALKGIEQVSKQLGYQYVLPVNMLLYKDGADDITGKVISALGGKPRAATPAPAANKPAPKK